VRQAVDVYIVNLDPSYHSIVRVDVPSPGALLPPSFSRLQVLRLVHFGDRHGRMPRSSSKVRATPTGVWVVGNEGLLQRRVERALKEGRLGSWEEREDRDVEFGELALVLICYCTKCLFAERTICFADFSDGV
jgi:hypothetical protein